MVHLSSFTSTLVCYSRWQITLHYWELDICLNLNTVAFKYVVSTKGYYQNNGSKFYSKGIIGQISFRLR